MDNLNKLGITLVQSATHSSKLKEGKGRVKTGDLLDLANTKLLEFLCTKANHMSSQTVTHQVNVVKHIIVLDNDLN